MPEAVNFLLKTCLLLSPHSFTRPKLPGSFTVPDFDMTGLRMPRKGVQGVSPKSPYLATLLNPQNRPSSQDKVDLLALSLDLIMRYSELYKSSTGFIDMFEPALLMIEGLDDSAYSEALRVRSLSTFHAIVDQGSSL